jgi:1-acyl-sn-glycerol-3-phosphate acyltransferase
MNVSLRAALNTASALSITVAMAVAIVAEDALFGVSFERRDDYVRTWAKRVVHRLGIAVDVAGPETDTRLPRPGGILLVSNHRSMLDVFMILSLAGTRILARGDMASWPGIGYIANLGGTLYVDRNDKRSRLAALTAIGRELDAGRAISVFAEGTTFTDDTVRPFHPGAFAMVKRSGGVVLPVGIAYDPPAVYFGDEPFLEHLKKLVLTPNIRAAVTFGAPVAASTPNLVESSRETVQALVHASRARLSAPQGVSGKCVASRPKLVRTT